MWTTTLSFFLSLLTSSGDDVFLSEREALKVIFGDASVARTEIVLEKPAREGVERRLGRRVAEKQTIYVGFRGRNITGYAILTEEIGKYLPITMIVGVSPEGRVIDTVVLVHREPIGGDCANREFLDQLRKKSLADPIRQDRDYLVVEGATLSCNGVARGVRKVLAIVDAACIKRPEFSKTFFQDEAREQRYRMGALCTIVARGPAARAAVDDAFKEIQRIEDVLSDYVPESELSRLNREGTFEPGGEFRRFLKESLKYAKETGGAFDITVGAAMGAWGFRERKFRVPTDEELAKLVIGCDKVTFEGRNAKLPKGMLLDPGAIGKGYAVDRAVELLKKAGITEALVDFGSTVYGYGREWTVAIRDPFDPEGVLGAVTIQDEAVGVSGSYERYFEHEGKRYTHILDPRTRRPVEGVAQTAVVAQTATEADVYSTAIFVDPKLADGRAALVIPDPKGESRATGEWKRRFKEK